MERLTKHYKDSDGYYKKCSEACYEKYCERCALNGEPIDRLGLIEDILGDTYDLDRLREAIDKKEEYERFMKQWEQMAEIAGAVKKVSAERVAELVEADKAGRCVVLPVKPGDTVWYLTGNPSMTNRLCFDRVDSARVVGFYFDERGMQVRLDYFHGSHGTYGFYEKTVFSTREAAEAALAKGGCK